MKIAYLGCVVGGLVVGVGLGWAGASHVRPGLVPTNPAVTTTVGAPPAAVFAEVKLELPREVVRSSEAETLRRLEVLKWFNQRDQRFRRPLRVDVFDTMAELSRGFVSAFGLSAEEAASLQEAVRNANERMSTQLAASATVRVDADNSRVWVELPAMPTEGGRIHDELLRTFEGMLGPDRLPYFNEMAADSFEGVFRTFGVRQSTFEVQRKEVGNGRMAFSITERWSLPDSSGDSHSLVLPFDLAKSFPVLAKVLPTTFTQP